MRPASPEFLAAITQQQTALAEARLTDASGTTYTLNLTDGSVTLDATQAWRGSADLTVIDEDLIPEIAGDPLTPYGNEVQVLRGLELPDGTPELISLGHFPISTTSVDDTGESLDMRLSLFDRAQKVSTDAVEAVYQVPEGSKFTDAIIGLVGRTYPDVQTSGFDGIDYVTPITLGIEEQGDPWEFAQNLAMAIGCDLYFDGDGVLVLRSVHDLTEVAQFNEGDDGVLLRVSKEWSRENVHNRWIVTVEAGGSLIIRGEATDDDPGSPTFYGGPFGRVPRWETLEYVNTGSIQDAQNQVNLVASLLKQREMGKAQALEFGTLVHPALEPDDVVRVTREKSKLNELHVLDSLQIPLMPDQEMSGNTRMVRVAT